jgi:hypothetical protein
MTEPATEDPQQFAAIIRTCWAVTSSWNRLHAIPHGPWTREQADEIAFDWRLSGPVRLACGRTAAMVCIPGLFSRSAQGGRPRCLGCCRATGLSTGIGSPLNDDECRKLLGLDD